MIHSEFNIAEIIEKQTQLLYNSGDSISAMPSTAELSEMMGALNTVIFLDFSCRCAFSEDRLRRMLYDIYITLREQINVASGISGKAFSDKDAKILALKFTNSIHELRRVLFTDVEAIMHNDPAARSPHEVISSYPAIKALLHYRAAHLLFSLGVPIIPRIITELAHSSTGIDIHPGAVIGEHFGIDHGTGVVIGETSIIGHHVTIYQGVTLGAKNFEYDAEGLPRNVARHPIIEDNVTIYSNTSVLGRITVGHDTVVGGNVWLTHSVPPYSRILQSGVRNEIEHEDL